ncbi:MAG: arginine repressor [Clostridiales bacterium]|nr:arginine repressor [Clostridiales bacterium]
MARSLRQSKILEIIANKEIETQDELVQALRNLNYDVTQATVSRDIKELGLIKILSDSKKYKYAYVETNEQQVSNKIVGIYKEVVISVKTAQNLVVVKTLKGFASSISQYIDKMNLDKVMGTVFGDDTVMCITENNMDAEIVYEKFINLI